MIQVCQTLSIRRFILKLPSENIEDIHQLVQSLQY
jgi:hypothetical protein